ncbi:MAG: hypothetical protein Q8Q24_01335, partial [bacterium]|nr:hypothetical protein [bacterium]
ITCSPGAGPDYTSITATNPDGTSTAFQCAQDTNVAKISMVGSGMLTGSNVTLDSSGGMSCAGLTPLKFTCSSATNPQSIKINFTLYQKGSGSRPEEKALAAFQTTISSRTY